MGHVRLHSKLDAYLIPGIDFSPHYPSKNIGSWLVGYITPRMSITEPEFLNF
jgi:hypothetical protein